MKRGNKRKFGRPRNQRTAFVRSLATALIDRGKITTTQARAKTLRTNIEKLITTAKGSNAVAARRLLAQRLGVKAVSKLVGEIVPLFTNRRGGYTRIMLMPPRASDGARMAMIEFIR